MSSSVGKRQREQQRRERAQVKAERKAARRTPGVKETDELPPESETDLIKDLGTLQRTFEAGEVSPEDFERRRDRIQRQLEQLSQ